MISIHALLAESDITDLGSTLVHDLISIHALLAESDLGIPNQVGTWEVISIHALLAESDYINNLLMETAEMISIHALLAESDDYLNIDPNEISDFYPRSPCGERPIDYYRAKTSLKFLSTLSLRRATSTRTATQSPPLNFYPRSPCGERQTGADTAASNASISIHALLAESDAYLHVTPSQIVEFLSTLSLRRATCQRWQLCCADRDFYPRSPCGERLSMDALESYLINISIHALLAESDDP